jgi:hypothetical protein
VRSFTLGFLLPHFSAFQIPGLNFIFDATRKHVRLEPMLSMWRHLHKKRLLDDAEAEYVSNETKTRKYSISEDMQHAKEGDKNKITVPKNGLDSSTTMGISIVKEEQIVRVVEEFEKTGGKTLVAEGINLSHWLYRNDLASKFRRVYFQLIWEGTLIDERTIADL